MAMATSLNHVSIVARDLEESVRFYEELFGLERIPTPNFGYPVQWLRAGDLQLHVFVRPSPPAPNHHFALSVADFESVYLLVRERQLFDAETMGGWINQLPDGSVQMYLRDPAGNLVEVDYPDAASLDRAVVDEMPKLVDRHPQGEQNRAATLFLARRAMGGVPDGS